jgi:hypothetical protein
MRKIKLLFIMLIVAISGCNNKQLNQEISTLLDTTVREGKTTFKIEGISVNWDALLIVPPYTNLKKLKTYLNIDVYKLSKTGIEQRDDICVLVFLKEKNIVFCVDFSRATYDFSELSINKYYTKESIFQLSSDKLSSKPRYIVREK